MPAGHLGPASTATTGRRCASAPPPRRSTSGASSWLPRQFLVTSTVRTRRRIPDVVVTVRVELVDPSVAAGVTLYEPAWSTPVARSVEVAVIYGEVQARHLREVRIVDLVEAGASAVAKTSPDTPDPGSCITRNGQTLRRVVAPPAATTAVREVTQARGVLRTPRIDLGLVAHAYTEAERAGRRDPTVAVAESIDRSRSMAASYVRQARDAGLLGPPGAPPPTAPRPPLGGAVAVRAPEQNVEDIEDLEDVE